MYSKFVWSNLICSVNAKVGRKMVIIISSAKSLSFYTSSRSTSRDHSYPHVNSASHVMSNLPFIVSSIYKAECCTMSHHHYEILSPTVDGKSLLSSLSLSSTGASSGVCEVVVPPDSLKDLVCYNLSSCNLLSMVAEFLELARGVHLPWVAEHLVERASIALNLQGCTWIFWKVWWIHYWTI